MAKYLVTGGAGFIGSHLVEKLISAGDEVVVIDDFNDYYDPSVKRKNIAPLLKNSKFTLFEKDIRDNLDEVFAEGDISAVVHLAARAGVRPSLVDPALYNSVNVIGTVNLLEACKTHNIKKFIFGSSSSVYGVTSTVPFREDDPLEHPISPYAVTKIAGENLCKVYHNTYGISCVCLRFFTVYGPRQRPEMAIHKFTRMISQGKPIPFYGDGTSSRDYTFISDILDGVMAGIKGDFGFEVINLGNSNTVTLRQLVDMIEKTLGIEAKLEGLPFQKGDVPITYADVTKAGSLLGYKPKVNIREGIEAFVDWYRKNAL